MGLLLAPADPLNACNASVCSSCLLIYNSFLSSFFPHLCTFTTLPPLPPLPLPTVLPDCCLHPLLADVALRIRSGEPSAVLRISRPHSRSIPTARRSSPSRFPKSIPYFPTWTAHCFIIALLGLSFLPGHRQLLARVWCFDLSPTLLCIIVFVDQSFIPTCPCCCLSNLTTLFPFPGFHKVAARRLPSEPLSNSI